MELDELELVSELDELLLETVELDELLLVSELDELLLETVELDELELEIELDELLLETELDEEMSELDELLVFSLTFISSLWPSLSLNSKQYKVLLVLPQEVTVLTLVTLLPDTSGYCGSERLTLKRVFPPFTISTLLPASLK